MKISDFLRYDPSKPLDNQNRFSAEKAELLKGDYEARKGGGPLDMAKGNLVSHGMSEYELTEEIKVRKSHPGLISGNRTFTEELEENIRLRVDKLRCKALAKIVGMKDNEIDEYIGLGKAIAFSRRFMY